STVRRILRWMDSLKPDEPFLVMYLPIAGHHPYEVPGDGPFQGSDERTRYLNALHYGDASLGELLNAMKARGTDTNTVFIVYGDHGEAFGQHAGNFGHTFFVYEENVHVPLLIAAPGLIEEPLRIKNIASLLDLAPTLVDLIGLNAPADWQGTSLLNNQPRTALFFTDYSLPLVGLRDGHNKIICELGTDRAQMFDLIASPCETRNAASDDSTLLAIYRRHLESWAAAQKALLKPAGRLTMRQMHPLAGARETQSKSPSRTGPTAESRRGLD
ncbi:MAG TPA: sulfatase-like hydrolase/transferase, partial [Candidatus Binatia bacterium]|nr:sulfatase-like hydrolase/transferase [Candidatus Binatia bacterium]